jgi:hypothetical protein
MKIAEETGDNKAKDKAIVNFGMANANMKWGDHQSKILTNITDAEAMTHMKVQEREDEDDDDEEVFMPVTA